MPPKLSFFSLSLCFSVLIIDMFVFLSVGFLLCLFLSCCFAICLFFRLAVVCLHRRTSAWHNVHWWKYFFLKFSQIFPFKTGKRRKKHKVWVKIIVLKGVTSTIVLLLNAARHKSWSIPCIKIYLLDFS